MQVRRWVAAVAVLPLLLAGCGGGDDPSAEDSASPSVSEPSTETASPTESASASETASAHAAEPIMPTRARRDNQSGAVAFARFYIQAIRYAVTTGDFSVLDSISADDCASCQNARSALEKAYAQGKQVRSPEYAIKGTSQLGPTAEDGTRSITIFYVRPKQQVIKNGQVAETNPKREFAMRLELLHVGDAWEVQQWNVGT